MKPSRRSRTKIASLPSARWVAYSAAALASGFIAGTSDGEIHYSGFLDQRVAHRDQVSFSLGAPGVGIAFRHGTSFYGSGSSNILGGVAIVSMYGGSGEIAGFRAHSALEISNLPRGAAVSGLDFLPNRGFLAGFDTIVQFGQFLDPGVGWFGFRFNLGTGDQYGWARVKMRGADQKNTFRVIDYAYGDPGESVFVGQRTSQGSSAQSVGDLAAGGAALRAGRVVHNR